MGQWSTRDRKRPHMVGSVETTEDGGAAGIEPGRYRLPGGFPVIRSIAEVQTNGVFDRMKY